MIDLNLCDPQQAQALLQIKETGNDQLPSLLRAEAETAKAKLVTATDTVSIHRLQGRAEAFEDLLRAIEDSPKVVKRL